MANIWPPHPSMKFSIHLKCFWGSNGQTGISTSGSRPSGLFKSRSTKNRFSFKVFIFWSFYWDVLNSCYPEEPTRETIMTSGDPGKHHLRKTEFSFEGGKHTHPAALMNCLQSSPLLFFLNAPLPQRGSLFPGDKSQMTESITRTNGPPPQHLYNN